MVNLVVKEEKKRCMILEGDASSEETETCAESKNMMEMGLPVKFGAERTKEKHNRKRKVIIERNQNEECEQDVQANDEDEQYVKDEDPLESPQELESAIDLQDFDHGNENFSTEEDNIIAKEYVEFYNRYGEYFIYNEWLRKYGDLILSESRLEIEEKLKTFNDLDDDSLFFAMKKQSNSEIHEEISIFDSNGEANDWTKLFEDHCAECYRNCFFNFVNLRKNLIECDKSKKIQRPICADHLNCDDEDDDEPPDELPIIKTIDENNSDSGICMKTNENFSFLHLNAPSTSESFDSSLLAKKRKNTRKRKAQLNTVKRKMKTLGFVLGKHKLFK